MPHLEVRTNTQTTVMFLAVADFFLFVSSFGTHDVTLFLWPASAEILDVKSAHLSVRTAGPTHGHTTGFSIFFVGENEAQNQLLPKFHMGHISVRKLVENVCIQND